VQALVAESTGRGSLTRMGAAAGDAAAAAPVALPPSAAFVLHGWAVMEAKLRNEGTAVALYKMALKADPSYSRSLQASGLRVTGRKRATRAAAAFQPAGTRRLE
jgi:hypothetical protein